MILIILNTFNRAHLILETLNSIKNQSYTKFHCLIIDDFSTDNTSDIVSEFIKADSRFRYLIKPKEYVKGLSAGRNYGLDLAEGIQPEFIQFFDDDDIMHPKKLELQMKELQKDTSLDFSICGAKNFNQYEEIAWDEHQENTFLNKYSLADAYLIGDIQFVAQVPLFKYSFAKNFRFDDTLFYAEEWVLFVQEFYKTNPKFSALKKVLFYRRKHANSITENNDENFSRRKTSAVVGIKIFNYLDSHHIHTKTTLLYFTRQFLLYKYDSKLLSRIQEIIGKDYPELITRFKIAILGHWFMRKVILKILKF
ncbi:glycosyltransferase family 2 protein [Salegentibacter sp. UBA1130]|uniref:glycosyltransferase family 2 protein n=1 Tax=Salegentibacter sp. UBA1130 TaxID=1947451 RepID=UPI00257B9AFF|nr:glycosyltransferase family 2 protein [Salegentibacter sp. UBA1130]